MIAEDPEPESDQWGSVHHRSYKLLNQSWPPNARTIRNAPTPIRVEARLVWEDGQEWVPAHATRWTRKYVFLSLWHRRLLIQGAWLDPVDVRRIDPPQ
ncbi:hypothetical protein [Rudaeicoccus suwonensis]|uniref:Uncharacterized protein n=1 Tax=Rudaeicoccus suwonensis TaxID=657409 RepID=A0A561DVG7_9MICO|nr:hypothetical protein [Rudaeicoccus suwonensis]TWE07355.1 hypothetical protein BKA23_3368 [Rudaeicoccus suwonensis]